MAKAKRRNAGPRRGRPRDAQRAERWRKFVLAWEASGLSQAEFCRRRKVSVHTFRWWRYTLGLQHREEVPRSEPDKVERPAFVEVKLPQAAPAPASSPAKVEIALEGGPVIRVHSGFDAETLKEVLAVLRVAAC